MYAVMSCINKSSVSYQQLVDAYGDDIAEAAVRKMSAEKGLEDSFYIPSIEEVESLINASVPAAPSVKDAALMGLSLIHI